jgi:hypothetical protein
MEDRGITQRNSNNSTFDATYQNLIASIGDSFVYSTVSGSIESSVIKNIASKINQTNKNDKES